MKTLLPVLAGLLAIGALTYLRANHHRPHFEADLTSRTQAALTAIPIPKADVSAEGQIILRGEVASVTGKAIVNPTSYPLRNNLAAIPGRADAVVEYLVQKGVPNEPVADNKTPQGRQKNRRTEFKGEGNLA